MSIVGSGYSESLLIISNYGEIGDQPRAQLIFQLHFRPTPHFVCTIETVIVQCFMLLWRGNNECEITFLF